MSGARTYTLSVEVPAELVSAYEALNTGDDDDIVLAAEKAMRERLRAIVDYDLCGEDLEVYPVKSY